MAVAIALKKWTLEELHSLPDDGNKYELIYGELFVTPAPTDEHETILAKLAAILVPYVAANGLGYVYHPRAVLRRQKSEVEPDLQVRQPHPRKNGRWETAPIPTLVVEVHSPYTRRRDQVQKRAYYLNNSVAEYWMVDAETETITVVRASEPDVEVHDRLTWSPRGASAPLELDVRALFH